MKRINSFILILIIAVAVSQCTENNTEQAVVKHISNENYELYIPKNQKALLVLFPCFPCDAENTKQEFNILETATKNNVTVLMMNFNQHLWLTQNEKKILENILIDATTKNNINTNNTFIGGFSSGGNVSLLLSDYLKATNSAFYPTGVFIADSPIDLLGLYENAKKTISKNFSEIAIQEANWIVNLFDSEFGIEDSSLTRFEHNSPYVSKTHSIQNLTNLDGLKVRFYSEPDVTWWKENRLAEYEDMNAYYIEQLSQDLNRHFSEPSVSCIQTKNRGFRSNGERHPHSWSIIDEEELIHWMIE